MNVLLPSTFDIVESVRFGSPDLMISLTLLVRSIVANGEGNMARRPPLPRPSTSGLSRRLQ